MCKNIELRLYIEFIIKVRIFRVLWPIVQVYNDTSRGNSVARRVEAPLLSTVVTIAHTIVNGEFTGWPTTHHPVSTNPDCLHILAPEPIRKFYILHTHCIYMIHAANMQYKAIYLLEGQ